MILLNPGLLWFLPGALLPLLLHLLWRRRLRLIPWGAMGPLRHLRQQHLRQLVFERWTLLLLRMLMLAALLLALCRPVWQLASDPGWRGVDGRTAAVILIDDSPSSRRGRERQAWEVMQDLLASYLAGLQPGDEVSLLRASQLGIGAGEPRFDHERLQRHVAGLRPTDVRSDLPALFAAGLEQLEQHINPQAELVLVTDDAADGWARLEDPAWDPLWQALQSAAPPRVLHLRGRGHPAPGVHHAVAGLQVPSPLVLSGETVPVAVDLQHWGPLELPRNLLLRLSVDGIPRQERLVSVQAAGGQTVELPIRLDANGGHSIGVHLLDAADDDPSDDGAHVAVNVVERLPVLIVTGGSGSSRFLRAALEAAPPDATSVFTVEQLHFSQLDAQRLARVRVVVLQDVPVLPSEQVAALEQFVVGGGGVLVSCGPGTDVDLVNRFWARGGDGFLPTPVHPARDLPPGTVLQAVAPGHPVLNGLPGGARWQTADVHRALLPDPDRVGDAGLVVLVRLDDGSPFCLVRPRGAGLAALWAGTLDRRWGEAPLAPVFPAFMRSLIQHLGSRVQPSRTVHPGHGLVLDPGDTRQRAPVLAGPDGLSVALEVGRWRGERALRSAPLQTTGVYRFGDERYVCAPWPSERGPGATGLAAAWQERTGARIFQDPAVLRAAAGGGQARLHELWPWCLSTGLTCFLLECVLLGLVALRDRRLEPAA